MDRSIVYSGQIPLETDLLLTNKNTMLAIGSLLQAVLGTNVCVDGLACTPNSPAALNVLVGPGSIYSLQNVDGTAYGSIAADTTNQTVKQGLVTGTTLLSCLAPGTTGQSVVYLIQAAYQDTDGGSTVLPYYNASNPSVPWSGPNNTGVSQNTVRKGVCLLGVKTGVAATTGTQVTPAPDAGYTGLYAVTVANGQTTITSGNIKQLATAPFISTKLPDVSKAIQQDTPSYALDTSGAANTITVSVTPSPTLTDGMPLRVKLANSVTGATVLNLNGGGNVSVVNPDGSALSTGPVANGIYTFVYDANGTRWQIQNNIVAAASPFTTGMVMLTLQATANAGWVMCDDGSIGSATSGATTRANADTATLYALLWNNVSDTYAPVTGGRGASAAADFAANKKIALTKMLGRALAIAGSGATLTARTLGQTLGEETHILSTAEMPSHTHDLPGNVNAQPTVGSGNTMVQTGAGGTVTTSSAGSGTAHNNMQPTSFLNAMIKL